MSDNMTKTAGRVRVGDRVRRVDLAHTRTGTVRRDGFGARRNMVRVDWDADPAVLNARGGGAFSGVYYPRELSVVTA